MQNITIQYIRLKCKTLSTGTSGQDDVPSRPIRVRARDIATSLDAWSRQTPLLHLRRVSAVPVHFDRIQTALQQEQDALVLSAGEPVSCSRDGCDGTCRPTSALRVVSRHTNSVLIVSATAHFRVSLPEFVCEICASSQPLQPYQVRPSAFFLLFDLLH